MTNKTAADVMICSFCGKTHLEVEKLIAGPQVYICGRCVDLCTQILAEDANSGS